MEVRFVLFRLDGMNERNFKVSQNDSICKDRLRLPISSFLEVSFEKFFGSHTGRTT